MNRTTQWIFLGVVLIASAPLSATDKDTEGVRAKLPYGLYASGLGDPVPSLLSLNAAYALNDSFRVNLGAGLLNGLAGDGYSIGAGIKYFLCPRSNLSPVVGIGAAVSHAEMKTLTGILNAIFKTNDPSQPQTTGVGAATLGLDWQLPAGLNVGAGVNLAVSHSMGFIPYVNLGWFFGR